MQEIQFKEAREIAQWLNILATELDDLSMAPENEYGQYGHQCGVPSKVELGLQCDQ